MLFVVWSTTVKSLIGQSLSLVFSHGDWRDNVMTFKIGHVILSFFYKHFALWSFLYYKSYISEDIFSWWVNIFLVDEDRGSLSIFSFDFTNYLYIS